ncbi:putative basic amino acid antiporter YfcC [Acetonema longum]|uniref:C4-dicarboxylate anaerobic carrier n=1 Tax=Acetonema longum DSM 6540 TaxID=1009370 RepID=F7NDN3_9FIRM|nr:putative basic amino acid antiporter YfcC [Acetonema longum]EGO65895.1 hypothetical protein ALO_00700 [Acetonema longum DSM 6540]
MSTAASETKAKKITMPHTYIIIFGVVIACWLLTFLIPLGKFDTHSITYMNAEGKEKSRTVLIPESFRYQYPIDNVKLKTNLSELVNNEAMLNKAGLDKAKIGAFLAKEPGEWDHAALDAAGLNEPVLYSLFKDRIYDTSVKLKSQANIWGTDDFYGFGVLNYVFEGLVTGDKTGSAVGIVAFILVIGGSFGILLRTGSVDAGIHAFIKRVKGYEAAAIPALFTLFSLGGAVFGMSEETIPFAMIVIPFVIALGYDSLVGIGVTFVASQAGNAASWMNPFGIAIAQGIAGVPVMSGAGFRIAMWVITTALGCAYLTVYANKIKQKPTSSIAYETDRYFREHIQVNEEKHEFKLGDKLVLLSFLAGIIWIIWGVTEEGYYIPEIASQFFVIGLAAGIIGVLFKLNNMKVNDIASSFQQGAADLTGAAIVVGMAKGIILVLGGTSATTPTVLNTILHDLGSAFAGLPTVVSALFMYVFQTVFNFFVTSGSGQAALTMPILAPLADVVGVSRQISTLAYQLGAGFADAFVPTSASLMGVLGVARIDWGRYAKWQIKMQGFFFVIGCIFIIVAVMIGFH